MKKIITTAVAVMMSLFSIGTLSACELPFFSNDGGGGNEEIIPSPAPTPDPDDDIDDDNDKDKDDEDDDNGKTDTKKLSMLKTSGSNFVDSNGNVVQLRGVNVGGISAIEQWMNGFAESSSEDSDITCIDHATTTRVFVDRFGKTQTKELWNTYKENWFNDYDFQKCVDLGFNTLRLPFTYMDCDFDAILDLNEGGKNYDFTFLDNFIAKASEYGLYVVLDMHGAYGSQNGKDHSGEVYDAYTVDFYTNEQKISLTCKLWTEIANRYKDNPTVAAYDILNEPAETTGSGTMTTEKRHWDVFDRIYDSIRTKDNNHVVIFESCWDVNNLPTSNTYGWKNYAYEYHHYTGSADYDTHTTSFNDKIESFVAAKQNVPIYMGEFTAYDCAESWDYTLTLMNAYNISWTSWTYKINSTVEMPWGIYNIKVSNANKINAHTDSYEEIEAKMEKLSTKNNAKAFKFANYRILPTIIQNHARGNEVALHDDGKYNLLKDAQYAIKVSGNNITLGTSTSGGAEFQLINDSRGMGGTVQLKINNKYLSINSDTNRLTLQSANDNKTKFFLIADGDEGDFKLLSYSARKYVRYDSSSQKFVADGTLKTSGSTFNLL